METDDFLKIKQRQVFLLIFLAILIGSCCYGAYYLMTATPPEKQSKINSSTVSFASPTKHINPEMLWREEAQGELKKTVAAEEKLAQAVDSLKNENQILLHENSRWKETIDAMKTEVEDLKKRNYRKKLAIQNSGYLKYPHAKETQKELDSVIENDSLKLTRRNRKLGMNAEEYVPAGSFAKAVLIGGVDASASAINQANPTPVLLRIIDQGTLPNHEHSSLKDCVVTAAAIGDISSERAMMRLERLSCTRSDTQILDVAVKGTVFGPSGKNGVRGNPVWRENALLERAFLAGTLSGFSDAMSEQYSTSYYSPFSVEKTIDKSRVAQYGVAKGVGKAMDRLADYHIQRAEQYHPVIQVSAGTVVDIVFLEGFKLLKVQ